MPKTSMMRKYKCFDLLTILLEFVLLFVFTLSICVPTTIFSSTIYKFTETGNKIFKKVFLLV